MNLKFFTIGIFLAVILSNSLITGYFANVDSSFSIETVAVCKEVTEEDCYYRCEDIIFKNDNGEKIVLEETGNAICHDENWIDPRYGSL